MTKGKYHILFWLVHTCYVFFVVYFRFPQFDKLDFLLYQGLLISIFYGNIFVFKYSANKKNIHLICGVTIVFVVFCVLKYIHRFVFLPSIGHLQFYEPFEIKEFVNDSLFNFIEYSLYSIGYWYTLKAYLTERKLRKIEREKSKAEKEILNLQNAKLIAEYNHLRAQINPHFLFNTLNTFYSNTEPVLPETAKGIMLLSDIMRYSLESGETDGKVSLREELTQLGNYVELMQLRFDGQLKIEGNLFSGECIQWPKDTQKWRILPHLLITMAENAFKHGNNREPFIINLYLEGTQLHFIFKNTIGMRKAETGTGIGLKNMIDRLGFTYNNNFRFESGVTGSLYTAELYITDNATLAAQDLNLAS